MQSLRCTQRRQVPPSPLQAVLCKFHEADKSGDGLLTSADLENVDFDILSAGVSERTI